MDSANSLKLIARVTYYVGWLFILCGALAHFIAPAAAIFRSVNLPQRNLFEGSFLLFLICAASLLRANADRQA